MRVRRWSVVVSVMAALAAVIPASGGAQEAPRADSPKIIKVADDFFSPAVTTVRPKRLIKWVWSRANVDTHNVRLRSAPQGVDKAKFRSASGSIGVRFERRLPKPGKYTFVCTFHTTVMRLNITVRR